MWNWWSKSSPTAAAPAPTTEEVLELTANSIDGLRMRRIRTLKKVHDLETEAKNLQKNGDHKQALEKLKQAQTWKKQASDMEAQILKLEQTNMAIDNTAVAADVVKSMKQGSEAIKSTLKTVTVDDAENAADDLEDAVTESKDLLQAVSRPFGINTLDDDEEALLLKQLEDWKNDQKTQDKPTVVEPVTMVEPTKSSTMVETPTKQVVVEPEPLIELPELPAKLKTRMDKNGLSN